VDSSQPDLSPLLPGPPDGNAEIPSVGGALKRGRSAPAVRTRPGDARLTDRPTTVPYGLEPSPFDFPGLHRG
jgi:hypothetical protein